MVQDNNKVKENYLRRWAKRLGLSLHKSRARRMSINNLQGYQIIDPYKNVIISGEKYDLDLDDVESILEDQETKLRGGEN